jgi:hypothetical protein
MPIRCLMCALLGAMLVLSAGVAGQDAKKNDPPTKLKGTLPANWKKLGLTDAQVQEVYKIQGKYTEEIDKLEAKIKDLKATRDKELKAVLTADQKKRLEEILVGKDKDTKKDK